MFDPNRDFAGLSPEQQEAVLRVVEEAKTMHGLIKSESIGANGEVYAYRSGEKIHWGVNSREDGICIARGVMPRSKEASGG